MRENFSVQGTIPQWLRISQEAFRNIGASEIVQDPKYARIAARMPDGSRVILNMRRRDNGRLLLEFDATGSDLIGTFKSAAAAVYRQSLKTAKSSAPNARTPAQQAARDRHLAQQTKLEAQEALAARARQEEEIERTRQEEVARLNGHAQQ